MQSFEIGAWADVSSRTFVITMRYSRTIGSVYILTLNDKRMVNDEEMLLKVHFGKFLYIKCNHKYIFLWSRMLGLCMVPLTTNIASSFISVCSEDTNKPVAMSTSRYQRIGKFNAVLSWELQKLSIFPLSRCSQKYIGSVTAAVNLKRNKNWSFRELYVIYCYLLNTQTRAPWPFLK